MRVGARPLTPHILRCEGWLRRMSSPPPAVEAQLAVDVANEHWQTVGAFRFNHVWV